MSTKKTVYFVILKIQYIKLNPHIIVPAEIKWHGADYKPKSYVIKGSQYGITLSCQFNSYIERQKGTSSRCSYKTMSYDAIPKYYKIIYY